jgi:hypothetical protein
MDGDLDGAAGEAKLSPTKGAVVRHRGAPGNNRLALRQVRPLLGPSCTIEGEDPRLYEKLLRSVADAIRPKDVLDWILARDVTDRIWLIQRLRLQRQGILRMGRWRGMQGILERIVPEEPKPEYRSVIIDALPAPDERKEDIRRWATDWIGGDEKTTKYVASLLEEVGYSLEDVMVEVMSNAAVATDRVDERIERHERRWGELLQEVERRRSKRVKLATEEVIEAEFEEVTPEGAVRKSAAPKSV